MSKKPKASVTLLESRDCPPAQAISLSALSINGEDLISFYTANLFVICVGKDDGFASSSSYYSPELEDSAYDMILSSTLRGSYARPALAYYIADGGVSKR